MSNAQADNIQEEFDTKKTVSYIVLALFLIVLLILVYNFKEKYLKDYANQNNKSGAAVADLVNIDSYESVRSGGEDDNNDGLSNWREMIYGSNASGIQANTLSLDEDDIVISTSTNLTELLSRDIYTAAQYVKNDSGINATSLVNAIDKNYSTLLKPSEAITLNVITNPTFEELRAYGNQMGLIFYAVLGDPIDTELTELSAENSIFSNTKAKIKGISKFCDLAKKIKVPLSMQDQHLEFVKNCSYYLSVLSAFANNSQDPYRALITLPEHQKVVSALAQNSKYYKNEFVKSKYKYSINEYGNYFNMIN